MSTLRSMLDLSRPTFSHHWSSTPFLCANIDRKSTRLNSSHTVISYAVFCLKKEEHTSEVQSHSDLVCGLLLEKQSDNVVKRVGGGDSPISSAQQQTQEEAAYPMTIERLSA